MKTQRAVSFDESSMESCATLQEEQRVSCESCESCESRESCRAEAAAREQRERALHHEGHEVTSLEEAKSVIAALRARQRAQAHQMLAWRRTLKLQEELVARLTREKAEQLRSLSSQLLLFESRLCRKQKEIEASLAQREAIILRQQRVIRQLQNKLRQAGDGRHQAKSSAPLPPTGAVAAGDAVRDTGDSPPCDALDRLDSLGDSDSAVVLEEAFLDDPTPPRFRSNITDVTVIRSVSDAVEPAGKYCSGARRCNGFLRRPEVLETVYSVEEDADADRADNEADEEDNNDEADPGKAAATTTTTTTSASPGQSDGKPRLRDLYGSFERLAQHETELQERERCSGIGSHTAPAALPQRTREESQQAQVTYNRVMSNHRSVTKPKDVKYKRINKAKSKSLEELRGRLRNWVEKGNKIAISLDQSYA